MTSVLSHLVCSIAPFGDLSNFEILRTIKRRSLLLKEKRLLSTWFSRTFLDIENSLTQRRFRNRDSEKRFVKFSLKKGENR